MIWQKLFSVVLLSFLPSALVSVYLFRTGRGSEFDKSLYIKMMIAGTLSVAPALAIVYLGSSMFSSTGAHNLLKAYAVVALPEEFIKLTIIALILYRHKSLRTVKDGIIYAVGTACGFAFAENVIYLTGTGKANLLIITRALTAVPLHLTCGVAAGLAIGISRREEKPFFAKTLLLTVLIHGSYNILVASIFPYNLLSIAVILFSLFAFKQRYDRKTISR